MKRREFLGTILAVPLCYRAASAQGKIRRLGYLSAGSPVTDDSPTSGPVIDGLKRLGWIEGHTIHFERRAAEGQIDRLPSLVSELVAVGVEAILTSGFPAMQGRTSSSHRLGRRRSGVARADREPSPARRQYHRDFGSCWRIGAEAAGHSQGSAAFHPPRCHALEPCGSGDGPALRALGCVSGYAGNQRTTASSASLKTLPKPSQQWIGKSRMPGLWWSMA